MDCNVELLTTNVLIIVDGVFKRSIKFLTQAIKKIAPEFAQELAKFTFRIKKTGLRDE